MKKKECFDKNKREFLKHKIVFTFFVPKPIAWSALNYVMQIIYILEFCYSMIITENCVNSNYNYFSQRQTNKILFNAQWMPVSYKHMNFERKIQVSCYNYHFWLFIELFTASNFFKRLVTNKCLKSRVESFQVFFLYDLIILISFLS